MRLSVYRIFVLLLALTATVVSGEEEVTWTPNEDAQQPALPLSMRQRQQLLQLGEVIQSSPDPEGTLQQVAEQNGMSSSDLLAMLQKNAQDLQQDPSLIQPTTLKSALTKTLASLAVVISQTARKHPRSFALSISLLTFVLYASITIPRTGMHISRGTTLFQPSNKYINKLAQSPMLERRPLSIQSKKMQWDDLMLEEDGTHVHKLPRSSELSQAVSAQLTLFSRNFDNRPPSNDEEMDKIDTGDEDDRIIESLFESAATVISERKWMEFPANKRSTLSATSNRHGVLVVPGLGFLGRYGLVRWQVTHQLETHRHASSTLTSLKGDFFGGQIHIEAQKYRSKVLLAVHLAVPKRSRRMNKRIAQKLVDDLVKSLGVSVSQRCRRSLASQTMGRRFKEAGHAQASERRTVRFDREKKMEEMSDDRRRRWQRSNPNAGQYRPSGDRQRSPNNC
eukprot:Nitzschia sp. Nitz4//scaffold36_size144017//40195//41547//NITZ4_003076-RA/size144017-processed-gene-0.72-mRNA-1//-1//CDS//3329549426//8597//frame0